MSKNKSNIIEAATKEAEAVRNLAVRRVQEKVLESIAPKIERSVLDALANPSSSVSALEAVAAKMVKEASVNFDLDPNAQINVHIPDDQSVSDSTADVVVSPEEPGMLDTDPSKDSLFGDSSEVEPLEDEGDEDIDSLFGDETEEETVEEEPAEEEPTEEETVEEEPAEEGGEEEEFLSDSQKRSLNRVAMAEAVLRTNAKRARIIREWVDYVDNKKELGRAYLAAQSLGMKISEDAKRLGVDPMKHASLKEVYVGTVKEVNALLESIKLRKKTLTENGGRAMRKRFLKEEEMDSDLDLGFDDLDADLVPAEAPASPAEPKDVVGRLAGAAEELEDLVDRLEDEIEALLGDDEEEEVEEVEEEEETEEPLEEKKYMSESRNRLSAREVVIRRHRAALVEARRRKEVVEARRRRALAEAIRRRRARRFESEAADTAVDTLGGEFDSTDLGDAVVDHDLEPADQLTPPRRKAAGDHVSDVRPTPAGTYEARLRKQLAEAKLREAKLKVAARIAANEKISTAKKRQIVEAVDRAKTIDEVKATYRAARVALAEAFEAPAARKETPSADSRRAEIVAEARRRLARRRAAAKLQEARSRRSSLNESRTEKDTTADAWARIAFKKN